MKYLSFILIVFCTSLFGQQQKKMLSDSTFSGLKFRNIGPAFASGRISDIAVHPEDDNCWYVAVGSGGVWKTANAGVTWSPIFDDQSSYSIGCITIDPNNPHTIWVGTGENVGGRHVGFGDGIYKSMDDGKSWTSIAGNLPERTLVWRLVQDHKKSDLLFAATEFGSFLKSNLCGKDLCRDPRTRRLESTEWIFRHLNWSWVWLVLSWTGTKR